MYKANALGTQVASNCKHFLVDTLQDPRLCRNPYGAIYYLTLFDVNVLSNAYIHGELRVLCLNIYLDFHHICYDKECRIEIMECKLVQE